MKKLMLVGLLTVLIGMPIGHALAAQPGETPEPNTLGDAGFYLFFPIAPGTFSGFDFVLFVSNLTGAQISVEVNTVSALSDEPVRTLNPLIPALKAKVFSSGVGTIDVGGLRCSNSVCQIYIHKAATATGVLDFYAVLEIFNAANPTGQFQFIVPLFFTQR